MIAKLFQAVTFLIYIQRCLISIFSENQLSLLIPVSSGAFSASPLKLGYTASFYNLTLKRDRAVI
jgi:hypothetical protein